MTLDEIKQSVMDGNRVFHHNRNYEVVYDCLGQWFIKCHFNGWCCGLTHMDGVTMNGKPEEFFEVKKSQ